MSAGPPPLNPPASTASADVIKLGQDKYNQFCSVCHGQDGVQTRGTFPNLMVTPLLHSQEGFDQVVLQGVRAQRGMASFAEALKPADTKAIRAYIIARANDIKQHPVPGFGGPPPPSQPHQEIGK